MSIRNRTAVQVNRGIAAACTLLSMQVLTRAKRVSKSLHNADPHIDGRRDIQCSDDAQALHRARGGD